MKDSFYSFSDVQPAEWKINIRGRLKHEAGDFLRSELSEAADILFLNSSRGWLYDSRSYMSSIRSDYVLCWIEDHICLVDSATLLDVITEMSILSVDQLMYSWFHHASLRKFASLPVLDNLPNIITYRIDKESVQIAKQKLGHDFYIVSLVSIFRKDFFLDILSSRRPWLKRWPKHLPFDFEKKSGDLVSPLIIAGMPKVELFASIDDHHGNLGYSLVSRGLYPNRMTRDQIKVIEYGAAPSNGMFQALPRLIRVPFLAVSIFVRRLGYSLAYFFE